MGRSGKNRLRHRALTGTATGVAKVLTTHTPDSPPQTLKSSDSEKQSPDAVDKNKDQTLSKVSTPPSPPCAKLPCGDPIEAIVLEREIFLAEALAARARAYKQLIAEFSHLANIDVKHAEQLIIARAHEL